MNTVRGGHEHQDGRRLWLVRHGETVGGSSERYFGSTDIALSALGREQVERLAPRLGSCAFAALVHSPLSRAVDSARILCERLAAPPGIVEVEDDLREVDFGDLEGLTRGEIEARFPGFFDDWRAGRTHGYPGGESSAGFRARVAAGIDRALARHPAGDVCVVAHRGVIKSVLVHLLGLSWAQVRPWSLDLGSASILVHAEGDRWTLDRYNLIGG
ncbi:MAG: histidine phosphatase family protein [Planctomycetota bacterium]